MPFTPTHILAIVPVFYFNRRLSLIALAIGAMIPDFPLFFPLSSYDFSHSLFGLLLYCVPMGFIIYLLFESIGKQFIIDLSPRWMRSRLQNYRNTIPHFQLYPLLLLALAFIIGAASHVLWDAFTHHWGWGVTLFPYLQHTIELFGFPLPYYKLIQYGSTFIGLPLLAIIGIFYLSTFEATTTISGSHFSKTAIYSIVLSFLFIPVVIALYYWGHNVSLLEIIGHTVPESIGAGITLFFIYALLYKWL
jgi:hypothetical protein